MNNIPLLILSKSKPYSHKLNIKLNSNFLPKFQDLSKSKLMHKVLSFSFVLA